MEKRILLGLIFILVVSGLVSAGFFGDIFNKITGKASDEENVFNFMAFSDYIRLEDFSLKDSTEDINLLYKESEASFVGIGKSSTHLLRTSNSNTITFDKDTDDYFIMSYNDGVLKESYLMRATSFGLKPGSATDNVTTFQYRKNGNWIDLKTDAKVGDFIMLGYAKLTVDRIDRAPVNQVTFTAGENVVFNKIYDTNGNYMTLPVQTDLPVSTYTFDIYNSMELVEKWNVYSSLVDLWVSKQYIEPIEPVIQECSANTISSIWDSIFEVSSSNITIFTSNQAFEGICTQYFAYKISGNEGYILVGFLRDASITLSGTIFKTNTTRIYGYQGVFKQNFIDQLNAFNNLDDAKIILSSDWGNININSSFFPTKIDSRSSQLPLQNAVIEFNSIFEKDSSGFEPETFYTTTQFEFNDNLTDELYYHQEGGNVNADYDFAEYYYIYRFLRCFENWSCTNWGSCVNGQQTRTCTDSNSCGTTTNKLPENQSCTLEECTENWSCTNWGSCVNGQQTRTCTDSNSCGTIANKSSTSKSCTIQQQEQNEEEEESINLQDVTGEVKFKLNGKDVTITRDKDGKFTIDYGEDLVETSLNMIKDSLGAYIINSLGNNKKIEVTVEDAIMAAKKIEEIDKIEIEEYKTLGVYSIYGTKKVRLFFIFPIKAKVVQKINIENGRLMATELPWWRFFALGI